MSLVCQKELLSATVIHEALVSFKPSFFIVSHGAYHESSCMG